MKRLRRWLFNLAAVVSLILCAATAAMWVRSTWRVDLFYHSWPREISLTMISDDGQTCCIIDSGGNPSEQSRPYPIEPSPSGRSFERESNWKYWKSGAVAGFNIGVMDGWWQQSPSGAGAAGKQFQSLFRWRTSAPLRVPATPHHLQRSLYITAPHWLLMMVTILLPAYWLFKRNRRARIVNAGLCLICGYDLRATPERCPECGAIPAAEQGATR